MKYPDERARRRHRNERIAAAGLVTALLLGLGGFLVWNRREEEAFQRERAYIPAAPVVTPEVELLREYLRIDTSNPPGREAAGARWLARQLEARGIRAELIESAPGRLNVYARVRGRRPGEGLLLLQHIDVVPPGQRPWKQQPFGGEIRLGELYGRGAIDMKGIGITHLLAFADVARGSQPERDVALLAVSDEERGGTNGMGWLIEHRPDLFDGIRYALGEGGVTEMIGGKVTYFGIEIGNKHFVQATVTAPSLEALRSARFALEPWNERRRPDRVLPEVRRFLSDVAPTRKAFRDELGDVDRSIAEGTFWKLPEPYRQLTQNVIWLTNDTVVDGRAEAKLNMLLLPDENGAAWLARVKETIAPHGAAISTILTHESETPLSHVGTPMFDAIAAEARHRYGARAGSWILHRQSNDSRYLRRRGIDAYGVQPYPVDADQSDTIHHPDERVRIDWFADGVAFMRGLVARWARPGEAPRNDSPASH